MHKPLKKVQKSGSDKDFGVTEDSKLYFNMSTTGLLHKAPNPTPPSLEINHIIFI